LRVPVLRIRRSGAIGSFVLAISIISSLFAAGPARAASGDEPVGFYVGLRGGITLLEDIPIHFPCANGPVNEVLRSRIGGLLNGNAGYAFGNGIRVEVEIPYRTNGLDPLNLGSGVISTSGSISSVAVMGNLLYDIPLLRIGGFRPYIGAGVGYSHVWLDNVNLGDIPLVYGSSNRFAYQFIAGVRYAIAPAWLLTLDYRYFATADPTFQTFGGKSTNTHYQSHNVSVGLQYQFGP
jgi:OmpA-OmpF porin, OOP family